VKNANIDDIKTEIKKLKAARLSEGMKIAWRNQFGCDWRTRHPRLVEVYDDQRAKEDNKLTELNQQVKRLKKQEKKE